VVKHSDPLADATPAPTTRTIQTATDLLNHRGLRQLIIPAPTVTPVASSMRLNDPVVRFFE
jgi:hypothetical protein